MGRVKIKRNAPSLDMTPMVDLAFLLVTFFMLTTNFRPDEPVSVSIPSSVSELKAPPTNIMTITLTDDNRIFFDMTGQGHRMAALSGMAGKYNVQFTQEEIEQFALLSSFGLPMGSMKQYLSMSTEERKLVEQPGIPADSLNNQLKDWILMSRLANPKARIAVKGDQNAPYPGVEKVISSIQDAGVNRFNLITSLEKGEE